MQRGFKKRAEEISIQQRNLLGLLPENPLPARELSKTLGVSLVTIDEIPNLPRQILHQLINVDAQSWSAVTISINQKFVIIHNHTHSPRRQESDLMHEMAHVICNHKPSEIVHFPNIPFPLRSYDSEQEHEAAWLGACLQLPRLGLLWALRIGMKNQAIATYFMASEEQVRYRIQVTGVHAQIKNSLYKYHR